MLYDQVFIMPVSLFRCLENIQQGRLIKFVYTRFRYGNMKTCETIRTLEIAN